MHSGQGQALGSMLLLGGVMRTHRYIKGLLCDVSAMMASQVRACASPLLHALSMRHSAPTSAMAVASVSLDTAAARTVIMEQTAH